VVNARIYTAREQWAIPLAARGCDLLHVPHYNAPLLARAPMVITIYDLIHITEAGYRTNWKTRAYAWTMLNLAARKARHIITVSEYTRAQIVERLHVPAWKVSAILCGVDDQFVPRDREPALREISIALGIREPYLLYVGNLKRHKNVGALLKAFALLGARQRMPQRLLLLGNDAQGKREVEEESARLGIRDRVNLVPHVERGLLAKLYAAADALVMPSTLEGFGLPVLEAMACGTPVVCSQAASLPEVGGDAVLYFDPQSPEDLAGAIERVLGSAELRETLRAKGLKRAARFTWSESVKQHLEVYRRALG
jgi:glycosyltransferase involved in cell wall biosynthesis